MLHQIPLPSPLPLLCSRPFPGTGKTKIRHSSCPEKLHLLGKRFTKTKTCSMACKYYIGHAHRRWRETLLFLLEHPLVTFLIGFTNLKGHCSVGGFARFKIGWVGGNWVKCTWDLSVLFRIAACQSIFQYKFQF